MSVYKCKMCGGTIEFEEGSTVGVCDSCGTRQTLPRLDTERKANLYDRANHFRRNNEFDKAESIYEQILNEDTSDAEAYWSLVLCRYGIEYVEDPSTHRRVPTVNRAQFTSIFDDDNYKSALQYADISQRALYEEEANTINEIQKGILAISQNEEPFDIFICYKETDSNGRRTPDSVLANDLYHQLTQEGFKVFFSRITLEDKLGTAYEPYIFAALNSAKVMVVLGTRPEYFNAVWVKNEWSRYLTLVKQSNGKKVLIPAYRDMDPYDLPEEFSHLQAQDMSKLGFMQDLIRGIKKITETDEQRASTHADRSDNPVNVQVAPLLRRAFLFLEDSEWNRADELLEQVLNQDPENGEAYLGKLMIDLQIKKREDLENIEEPFDDNSNYVRAVRFGSNELRTELNSYVSAINDRNNKAEYLRKEEIYTDAVLKMNAATTEEELLAAAEMFKTIPAFRKEGNFAARTSDEMAELCLEMAEESRKEAIYLQAKSQMEADELYSYRSATKTLEKITGYKDADELITQCENKINEIKENEERKREEKARLAELERIENEKKEKENKKKKGMVKAIALMAVVLCFFLYRTIVLYIIPSNTQKKQKNAINNTEINVGDTVKLGLYEQDNKRFNGKEEIEWIVLSVDGEKALIISKYALDCKPYNESNTSTTWEECSLRSWLNSTFIDEAFGKEIQQIIMDSTVKAEFNPYYDTPVGNDTKDKVFLLSIDETNTFFDSNDEMKCNATNYCRAAGAFTTTKNICWWWLRTPGIDSNYAADARNDGFVYNYGSIVNYCNNAVRPALWINLDSGS